MGILSDYIVSAMAKVLDYVDKSKTGWINVKSFGATGRGQTDGTDDTEAIRKAIESASDGDIIYFPKGTYKITEQIVIDKKLTFRGDTISNINNTDISTSKTESAIYYGGEANTTMFTKTSTMVSFENMSFYGKSFTVTETGNVAVSGTPAKYYKETVLKEGISCIQVTSGFVNIRGCTFYGFSDYALYLPQHAKVVNSSFFNCYKGIECSNYDSLIEHCWFCKCAIGIYSSVQNNIFVYNTWFDQLSQHAIMCEAQTMLYMESCLVDMCDYSALYFPKNSLNQSHINARLSRCGMYYAGTDSANIENAERYKACAIYSHMITNSRLEVTCDRRAIKTGYGVCPSVLFESDGGFKNCIFNTPYSADNTETFFSKQAGKNNVIIMNGNTINKQYNAWKYDVPGVAIRSNAPNTFQAPNAGDLYIDSTKKNLYYAKSAKAVDWDLLTSHGDGNTITETDGVLSVSADLLARIEALESAISTTT